MTVGVRESLRVRVSGRVGVRVSMCVYSCVFVCAGELESLCGCACERVGVKGKLKSPCTELHNKYLINTYKINRSHLGVLLPSQLSLKKIQQFSGQLIITCSHIFFTFISYKVHSFL